METSQILTIAGWVISAACSAVCSGLVVYIREQRKLAKVKEEAQKQAKSEHDAAMEQGLRTLLRQQLIDYHRQYVASGGPCPVRIKEQATAVHDAYAALGGNGTGTQLWHEIMEAHVE